MLAAVSLGPPPRAPGNVSHDRLRGANELVGAVAMALGQLLDDVVDKGEELDSTLIDVKALVAGCCVQSAPSSKHVVPVHSTSPSPPSRLGGRAQQRSAGAQPRSTDAPFERLLASSLPPRPAPARY